MPSLSLFLGIGAATLSSVASATKYTAQDTFAGSSFFDSFNFVTEEKTNGFVKYVDRSRAESRGYVSYKDGDAVFGVDFNSKLDSSPGKDIGRESVRLEGKKEYNKGLFVLDIKHMPGGICGTWPAFWSLGREPWPVKGEIDIIEGVNKNSVNKFVLHTDTKCKTDGQGQTGAQALYDCALDGPSGASGCDVNDAGTRSFGAGFNANEGGHYVTEWQADGIKMWFFPRGSAPKSLQTSEPDTSEFGTPNANFKGDCDIEKRFMDQRFIFTNTFCGDWAGNVYANSGCPMYSGLSGMDSCKKYVAENPSVFENAYWRISSFKTYNKRALTSSSVAPSSTHAPSSARISSSSVRVSSSVVASSTRASSSSIHVSSSVAHSSVYSSSIVSSSSAQVTSSSTAYSSVLSSSAHFSSIQSLTTSSPQVSSSIIEPSSTTAVSSSYSHAISSSTAHDSSSVYSSTHAAPSSSPSASGAPYDHASSSSVVQVSSSSYSTSASETSYTQTSSAATSSETPYVHDSTSVYASASSSYSAASGSSSVFPTETPYSSSSTAYSSETPSSSVVYPSGPSSSTVHSDSTSIVDVSSTSVSSSSTPAPVYSVYPVGDGYEYGVSSKSVDVSSTSGYPVSSSKAPDASSKSPEYFIASSKTAEHDDYSATSSKTPEYAAHSSAYPSASTPASAYDSAPTPAYPDYPNLPPLTLLYSSYPLSSQPVPTLKTTAYETTVYTTTYIDVCPTGYTTLTTTVTATIPVTAISTATTQTSASHPSSTYAPPGFAVTTKYCAQGCSDAPVYVTVTVPCGKCQTTSLPSDYDVETSSGVSKSTNISSSPVHTTTLSGVPSLPTTLSRTKSPVQDSPAPTTQLVIPSSLYHAGASSANPKTSSPGTPDKPSSASDYNSSHAPAQTGSVVHPSGATKPTPEYSVSAATSTSMSVATASKAAQSSGMYQGPEYTGAASKLYGGSLMASVFLIVGLVL